MVRKFASARALLNDLLDRCEAGVASPLAYPDHENFQDIIAGDSFSREIAAAESVGGVSISYGTGRRHGEMKHVRLADPRALYTHLRRQPSSELASHALAEAVDKLDLRAEFLHLARTIAEAWSRGKTWCNLSHEDAQALRTSLMLAQAVVDKRHLGQDYRTFSRRVTGDSKALERLEAAVLKLVGAVIDIPPTAGPRAALSMLGIERFAPPLLLSGEIEISGMGRITNLPYVGLPPSEINRVRFSSRPAYVLTIENYASFNRHVSEADLARIGLTVYAGGYPSLGIQQALKTLSAALPQDVPFFHWSDIDPDGTWIFRTIEKAICRDLFPHLMSVQLAVAHGEAKSRPISLRRGEAEGSLIADLVDYLASPSAKHMEQEEIDPIIPDLTVASTLPR